MLFIVFGLILEMCCIIKEFLGVKVFVDVFIIVCVGEIYVICGENGVGKLMLMKVLFGVYFYGMYDGEILLYGEEQCFKDIVVSEQVGIVIIYQEFVLILEFLIIENIFFGNEIQYLGCIDWQVQKEWMIELFVCVGFSEDLDVQIKIFGVGKQQLIEIVKVFNKDVWFFIFDELIVVFNENDLQYLFDLIFGFKVKGIVLIMISYKFNEIEQIVDEIMIICDGCMVEMFDILCGEINEDCIICGMVGCLFESCYLDCMFEIGEVFFEVKDWWVQYLIVFECMVVKGLSINVCCGEVVGIVGFMGVGCIEFVMSIFGWLYGMFFFGIMIKDGQEVVLYDVFVVIKYGFVYVSEDCKVLGFNLFDMIKCLIVVVKLLKIVKCGVVDFCEEFVVVEVYCKMLCIKILLVEEGVGKLFGGNQQKVVLVKWMFIDFDLLIFDELICGIDVGVKYEIYVIINEFVVQGKGVIVIFSELFELFGIFDCIYIVFEGWVIDCILVDQVIFEDFMCSMIFVIQKVFV